jgi:hypothetical protein
MIKTRITGIFLLVLSIFLLFPPAYADIAPPPRPRFNYLEYGLVVLVGEAMAWLIGAEFLWRMIRKAAGEKQDSSRTGVYKLMLFAMILSFLTGVLFWKALGWI